MIDIRSRIRTLLSPAAAIGFTGLMMTACGATPEHLGSSQEAVLGDNTSTSSNSDADGSDPREAAADPDEEVTIRSSSSGDLIYGYAPPSDDTQAFYLRNSIEHGAHTMYSVGTACRSVSADGSVVDGADRDELPVGGGTVIHCTRPEIAVNNVLSFTTTNADADENWCLLFTYDSESYQTARDANRPSEAVKLDIRATSPTELTATYDGDPITIKATTGFSNERTWPLWVDVVYKIKDVKKAANVEQCNAVLGA